MDSAGVRGKISRVTKRIHDMVSNLTPLSMERCIFRVPDALRHTNEEFYGPAVLAIGPYHRGNPRLSSMEKHKVRYLKHMFQKYGETSLELCVQVVTPLESKARECYAEPIDSVSSDELIQMLVLDGCFILELLITRYLKIDVDRVIESDHLFILLQSDLLLIENQIPFFILETLFNTLHIHDYTKNDLKTLTLDFFSEKIKKYYHWRIKNVCPRLPSSGKIYHLLHLAHEVVCSGIPTTTNSPSQTYINTFFYSATKLKEANVRLTKVSLESTTSIFDIRFSKGELSIPTLTFDDESETEIRNFIAFEMCQQHREKRFFCFYTTFIDHLVASDDDVNLLIDHGIFNNYMIDAKFVNNMLSKFTRKIVISNHYIYLDISKELTEYCKRPYNKWRAILMQKYFNTPWAFISFLAGLLLLVFTITETAFTIKNS